LLISPSNHLGSKNLPFTLLFENRRQYSFVFRISSLILFKNTNLPLFGKPRTLFPPFFQLHDQRFLHASLPSHSSLSHNYSKIKPRWDFDCVFPLETNHVLFFKMFCWILWGERVGSIFFVKLKQFYVLFEFF